MSVVVVVVPSSVSPAIADVTVKCWRRWIEIIKNSSYPPLQEEKGRRIRWIQKKIGKKLKLVARFNRETKPRRITYLRAIQQRKKWKLCQRWWQFSQCSVLHHQKIVPAPLAFGEDKCCSKCKSNNNNLPVQGAKCRRVVFVGALKCCGSLRSFWSAARDSLFGASLEKLVCNIKCLEVIHKKGQFSNEISS